MKSLEIVNKWVTQLEEIKKCIEEDINKGLSWFNYEKLYKYLEDAEKIKADLEVLEILKKVVFKKYEMFYFVSDYGLIDRGFWVSDKSHECTEFELDEEEYNKVKQWLEKNENE
jgi:hypothetical protein